MLLQHTPWSILMNLMKIWRPSWIYPFPLVKSHKWTQKWIPWPNFSYFRGITLEYTPNIDDFIIHPVFKMAADAILNTAKRSMITSGYHLRKCSLGPTLQESTIKKTLYIFFRLPWNIPFHTQTISNEEIENFGRSLIPYCMSYHKIYTFKWY